MLTANKWHSIPAKNDIFRLVLTVKHEAATKRQTRLKEMLGAAWYMEPLPCWEGVLFWQKKMAAGNLVEMQPDTGREELQNGFPYITNSKWKIAIHKPVAAQWIQPPHYEITKLHCKCASLQWAPSPPSLPVCLIKKNYFLKNKMQFCNFVIPGRNPLCRKPFMD